MSKPLIQSVKHPRVGVIGGGKISEQHLTALRSIEGVQLEAVCDLSPALAKFTAERFNIASWHTDYAEMLDTGALDVVHVLTPPASHERIVRDVLERGCHVVVEKPITTSRREFQTLWQLAQSKGLRLVENHNYRFNAPIRKLHELISRGLIGDVEEVEVRMVLDIRGGGRYADKNLPHPSHRLPAGVIHEFISHLAYLMLHFLPLEDLEAHSSVRAAWRNVGGDSLFKYDSLDACILAHGATGRITFSSRQWPDGLYVTVRGAKGYATAELFHPTVTVAKPRCGGRHLNPLMNALANAGSLTRAGFGSIWGKIRNRTPYEGLGVFLRETYDAFESGGEPPVSFQQMSATAGLIDALLAPENQF